jgi:DNA-binding response OmpR family regulator
MTIIPKNDLPGQETVKFGRSRRPLELARFLHENSDWRPMKKKKVLVIDDEKDFGFLMKSFFAHKDYEVYIAYTLSDGMKLLEKENPDVIFLDNNLPDGLGWGKAEYILNHHPLAKLNLISALMVPKTSASSFRILQKPFRFEDLQMIMDAA